MLKLTKTGIGLLTKQYRSVLQKCLIANLCILYPLTSDAQYATLYGDNTFTGNQHILDANNTTAISLTSDTNSGKISIFNNKIADGTRYEFVSLDANQGKNGGVLTLSNRTDDITTLTPTFFRLNNSGQATGIDFATNVTAGTTNASHLATTGAVNQLLNYYYTFRVDERVEMIDYTSFFQKDFSTLQEVDLHIKNPTHLGAFTKCDEVCPRPSERFASSLSQEQMLKNDASVDAGTFSICSLQIENVNEKLSNVFEA